MRRPDRGRRASSRRVAAVVLVVLASVAAARPASAQGDARALPAASQEADLLMQGLELEQQGRHAAAAALYRRALATPQAVSAMLGIERVYIELGQGDSVLAIVDSVIRANP